MSEPASACRADPAGVPTTRYLLFFGLAVSGCAADLFTKHWVFRWRGMPRMGGEWWVWEGYVGIETALNSGALFGLGAGMSRWFAGLSVVALAGIVFWLFYHKAARDLLLTVALGCVTAGILGNLYDRLGLWHGADLPAELKYTVRDWILLRYGDYSWPNFNIADSLLVCGAGLLLWHAFVNPDESKSRQTAES